MLSVWLLLLYLWIMFFLRNVQSLLLLISLILSNSLPLCVWVFQKITSALWIIYLFSQGKNMLSGLGTDIHRASTIVWCFLWVFKILIVFHIFLILKPLKVIITRIIEFLFIIFIHIIIRLRLEMASFVSSHFPQI